MTRDEARQLKEGDQLVVVDSERVPIGTVVKVDAKPRPPLYLILASDGKRVRLFGPPTVDLAS